MKSDMIQHRRGSGGAAHIGYPMFGARGPLLAPEDGTGAGGSGGGTSGTSSGTTTTEGQPGTAPAGGNSEKLIPQSQVNALVAQARREGRESAQQPPAPQAGQQTTTQPKAGATPSNGELQPMTADAVQQLMQRERAFTRVTAQVPLTEKQLARMEQAFRADNPPDVSTWASSYLEDMGIVKPNATTTATPNGTTPGAPAAPPNGAAAPTVPGRSDPLSNGGLVDVFNLSVDQIEQLGPQGLRSEFEKILTAGRRNSGAPPRPGVMQRK